MGEFLGQSEHARINAREYPGTRQLCSRCDEPTGRGEDDTIWSADDKPLCEDCHDMDVAKGIFCCECGDSVDSSAAGRPQRCQVCRNREEEETTLCGCGRVYLSRGGRKCSVDPHAVEVCPACYDEWAAEMRR